MGSGEKTQIKHQFNAESVAALAAAIQAANLNGKLFRRLVLELVQGEAPK